MDDRTEIEMAHAAALKAEADWRAMRDQCARYAARIEELMAHTQPKREHVAWLLWCANQGYIKAEDRAILTNWFLEDPSTLHKKDFAERDGWLSMADEVIAAIHEDDQ